LLFWIGNISNCVFPIAELVMGLVYVQYDMQTNSTHIKVVDGLLWLSTLAVEVNLIASGCFLLWAVVKITAFSRNSTNTKEKLNLKMIILHSALFSLFIVSDLVTLIFYGNYLLHQNDSSFNKL